LFHLSVVLESVAAKHVVTGVPEQLSTPCVGSQQGEPKSSQQRRKQ
jgi:serine acetyltransferase